MIDVLFGLVACGALAIAAITFLRQRSLRDMLRDAQRRVYLAQARLNELDNTVQKELQALRVLVRRQSSGQLFEPTMKVADAIALDSRVRDVLAQFHLGGCSACAIDEEQTIAQAARSSAVDLERLMTALTALGNGQAPHPQASPSGGLLQLNEF
jgi:hypothetical protein